MAFAFKRCATMHMQISFHMEEPQGLICYTKLCKVLSNSRIPFTHPHKYFCMFSKQTSSGGREMLNCFQLHARMSF